MKNRRSETRGAALIIAILILAILLVVVLAFFQASRQEMHIATNYRNATQADLLAEGATAIAIAFLNHDLNVHPTVTTLDHAWKTYFNNAWAVGKPHLWRNWPTLGAFPLDRQPGALNVPVVDMDAYLDVFNRDPGDDIYIPRIETSPVSPASAYDSANNPFAVDYAGGTTPLAAAFPGPYGYMAGDPDPSTPAFNEGSYAAYQIHQFTDVDNDDDGLNDSGWIPIPIDRAFSQDGIDNDLDGYIDEGIADGFDGDNDGTVDEPDELNQPVERALFVYFGGNDNLDNDGDGEVDEIDEQRPFLTTALGPIDTNGDGIPDQTLPLITVQFIRPDYTDPDNPGVRDSLELNPNRFPGTPNPHIDSLDNDYDLVINERSFLAYELFIPPAGDPSTWTPEQREAYQAYRFTQALGFEAVSPTYFDPVALGFSTITRLTFEGESVCELAGRAAILITDENSRVNMNIAGGRNYREIPNPAIPPQGGVVTVGHLRRALFAGASPFEYETRMLPQLGTILTDRLWNLRGGASYGIGYASVAGALPLAHLLAPGDTAGYGTAPFDFDVSLPGFGRVDDNGNALWMAMDGIDNDGDGLIDEGLTDFDGDGIISPAEAWAFEGIDEPQEFQTYRPLRNRDPFPPNPATGELNLPNLAENDGADNYPSAFADVEPDDTIDEIGELGDRFLRSKEQTKLAWGIGAGTFNNVRPFTSVHGMDLNVRHRYFDANGNLLAQPVLSGPKLDFNYALPMQTFDAISRDWHYAPNVIVPNHGAAAAIQAFAQGLRRGDTAIFPPAGTGILAGSVRPDNPVAFSLGIAPDPELRAAQLAVNARDNGDRTMGQATITTHHPDDWWNTILNAPPRDIEYTQAGIEPIRINEVMVRPVRRIEVEADTSGVNNPNLNPNLALTDTKFVLPMAVTPWVEQMGAPLELAWGMYGGGTDTAYAPGDAAYPGVIGDRTYLATTKQDTDDGLPNVIQFRFGASDGLPTVQPDDPAVLNNPALRYSLGARYYLMMNTMDVDPVTRRLRPTVRDGALLRYSFKYARGINDPNNPAFDPDILADLENGAQVYWRGSATVGYRNMDNPIPGTESGMVFLPSDASPITTGAVWDPTDNLYEPGYGVDASYTVHIPPVNPADRMFLYVAVQFMDPTPPAVNPDDGISINFFDFSQEPDHEWVEVVNIAEGGGPINMSGWQLAVGDEKSPLGPTIMTVPAGTQIAPGGSLLLGFSKHDFMPGVTAPMYNNGISLTRAMNAAGDVYSTEPPIRGIEPTVPPANRDQTYSVFHRLPDLVTGALTDFIDNDGDGVADPDDLNGDGLFLYDSDGDGTADTDIIDKAISSTPDIDPLNPEPNKPWDRIVQLIAPEVENSNTLEEIARLVLRGGIFPNYPEHDDIDNDGDSAILATDGVDNDGDGLVDELDGAAEETLLGYRPDDRPEGFDEGRWEFAFDPGTGTIAGQRGFMAPASYSEATVPYAYVDNAAVVQTVNQPYLGSSTDHPEWKAFVERRWYGADAVPITLYQGNLAHGRVVDRITYTERDVINRSIDDILPCPYSYAVDETGDAIVQPFERVRLDSRYPTYWPDNSMAVDFYRSVERKHPLYNGDLTGTVNRWQATDGAYDDWSPSTSVYERDLVTGVAVSRILDLAGTTVLPESILFSHATSGSPLRMNLSQRYMENPNGQFNGPAADTNRWAFLRGRVRNNTYVSPGDLVSLTNFMDERTYLDPATQLDDVPINYARGVGLAAERQDASIQGVLLAQHRYDDAEGKNDMVALMGSAAMDPMVLTAGTANFYSLWPTPAQMGAGPWNLGPDGAPWNGTAVQSPQAWVPVFLFPLPGYDDLGAITLDPNSNYAYAANNGNATFQQYLFTGPYGGTMQNDAAFPPALTPGAAPANMAHLGERWPLQGRAVMYASGNRYADGTFPDFQPLGPRHPIWESPDPADPPNYNPAATALFEWDGADGLENGDYDLYICVNDDMARVAAADNIAAAPLLTGFGENLVGNSLGDVMGEISVDVEVFTDRSVQAEFALQGRGGELLGPDGRAWVDAPPYDHYPSFEEMDRGQYAGTGVIATQGDSFGLLEGKRPDSEGVIYYGTVRVENNYLALLMRNWTARGQVVRFSRVVLTPRPRTHGRLNLNTVETRPANFGATSGIHPFNPLMGTPGLLARTNGLYFPEGNIAPADPDFDDASVIATRVLGARQALYEHVDARYYPAPANLLAPLTDPDTGVVTYPSVLQDQTPPLGGPPSTLQPDIFDEGRLRLSRLSNLATTRSDVFEIVVTAQTGYLSNEDLNGDGRIDYRNDFVVTGTKKIRTVYER